jgi:TolB-like protein
MSGLIDELKRRNVFRVGLAYLALGWVTVEVTSLAVPALNLPESLNSIVFYLGLIGFPFALFFAWAFELTPDGLKREEEVDRTVSNTVSTGRKIDFIIIGFLAVAVLVMAIKPDFLGGDNEGAANAAPSIAVLPFEDFSPNKDQEYFSSGIAEEILNLLAKTDRMKVAARTSSFAFRGSGQDIRTIGEKLEVKTVLEGSIRKAGQTLRVTAQLINVEDGYHIWSETYDRDMTDIFAIQDEIAASILTSLKVHLLGEERQLIAVKPANLDAYNSYLIGRERMSLQTKADFEAAKTMFEEAIYLDPNFAPARAQLVLSVLELERLSEYGSPKEQAKKLTDNLAAIHLVRAEELAPNLPEVSAIKGLYALKRFKYEEAEVQLNRAISLNPNYAQAYLWRASVSYENNDFTAMLTDREKAYGLDPMSLEISRELAFDYRSFWRPEDAERIIARMFTLKPGHLDAYRAKLANLYAQGKYAETIPVIAEGMAIHPDENYFKDSLAYSYVFFGEEEKALDLDLTWHPFLRAEKKGWDDKTVKFLQEKLSGEQRARYLGTASDYYRAIGDKDNLTKILKERISNYETRGYPWNSTCNYYLIEYMRYSGMAENTDKMMADCRNRTEERVKAGYLCPCSWYTLVMFAVLDGRINDAVVRAHEWLDKGDYYFALENEPLFNYLRDHPEYPKLIQRNKDQMARQRRMYLATLPPSKG